MTHGSNSLDGKTLAELKEFAEAGRALAFVTEGSNPFGYFVRRFRDGTYSFTGRFPQQGARVPKILISGGMATYEDLINEAKNAFLEDIDHPAWSVMSESVRYCAVCGVPTERLMYCQWCGEYNGAERQSFNPDLDEVTQERKYSTPRLLSSLEEVAKTRTPIWDEWSGDIRIKLDTDVNNQEWYVIEDNSIRGRAIAGEAPCWAFPHFNGSHDAYSYVPVAFCFKTFASLLEEYPQHTKDKRWHYDKGEYRQRLEHAVNNQDEHIDSLEGKTLTELQHEIDLEMQVYPTTNHDVIVARLKDERNSLDRYVFLRYEDGTQREKPSRVPPTPIHEGGKPVNHVIHFFREPDGGGGILVDEADTYETFQELLENWPELASKPVWGTAVTLERLRYENEYAEKVAKKMKEIEKKHHEEMMAMRGLMKRRELLVLDALANHPF